MRHDQDTLEAIQALAGIEGKYSEQAYNFVLSSVEATLSMTGEVRHVSAEELLEGMRVSAVRQFGPMSKEVLNHWGIYTTRDIGNIVFELIGAGLLVKGEGDSIEEFDSVYDFRKVFEEEYYEN